MQSLEGNGFGTNQVNYLASGRDRSFPVRGKHAGATVGAATGLGIATFVPGVGPIIGLGMLASGLVGAALGAAAGAAIGKHAQGVPTEDLYFFDEAIRSGQTVVMVDAHDEVEETRARNLLERAGGRSVGAMRQEWWQNMRESHRHEFNGREPEFRAGFEAALHPATRGRDYEQCVAYIEQCYPEPCKTDAFRIGFNRGQDYFRRRMAARETE